MVYYLGMHTFSPKWNSKRYRTLVREAVLRNSGLGAHVIQQAEVEEADLSGNIQEAWKRAIQLSHVSLRYENAHLACERNPDKHIPEMWVF